MLVTLEGIDGCGKSTQAELLHDILKAQSIPFTPVREPGGTELGEDVRKVLLHKQYSISLQAELLLYMAARSELTKTVILPALKSGKLVICDRFTDSTLAYQGYGGGADLFLVRLLNDQATFRLRPHLTLLLDLSVEEAESRRTSTADRMESKDYHYHKRVRYGYLEIASQDPQRVKIIDASSPADLQAAEIWNYIKLLITKDKGRGCC